MRDWILKIIRKWVSEAINHDAIILGSVIRGLKKDITCLKGFHDWSDWSSMSCGNCAEMERMKQKSERLYSYRHCWNCHIEMPESRLFNDGEKQTNAKEYVNKI